MRCQEVLHGSVAAAVATIPRAQQEALLHIHLQLLGDDERLLRRVRQDLGKHGQELVLAHQPVHVMLASKAMVLLLLLLLQSRTLPPLVHLCLQLCYALACLVELRMELQLLLDCIHLALVKHGLELCCINVGSQQLRIKLMLLLNSIHLALMQMGIEVLLLLGSIQRPLVIHGLEQVRIRLHLVQLRGEAMLALIGTQDVLIIVSSQLDGLLLCPVQLYVKGLLGCKRTPLMAWCTGRAPQGC
mmetsp:Transcript_11849/g.31099  ORF Transcript_11849/g.31099 Transcript_11849/m.31099 type:complete len:244 (+) Transcript_11849:3532-4263(+)